MDSSALTCFLKILPECSVEQLSLFIENSNEEFKRLITDVLVNILFYPFGLSLSLPHQSAVKVITAEYVAEFRQLVAGDLSSKTRNAVISEYSDIISELFFALKSPIIKYLCREDRITSLQQGCIQSDGGEDQSDSEEV